MGSSEGLQVSPSPEGTQWLGWAQQLEFPAPESSVLAMGSGWWLLCRHKARIVPLQQGSSYGQAEQLKTRAGSEENEV